MLDARTLARSLLAGTFVADGMDAVRDPAARKDQDGAGSSISSRLGLAEDPLDQRRLDGAIQLVAGGLLAMGWMPRLAAVALGATMIPASLSSHAYWKADDLEERNAQKAALMKDAAILGGLVMVALDTGGRPSLFWSSRKAASGAAKSASAAMSRITD